MITVTKKDLVELGYGTSFSADIIKKAKELMNPEVISDETFYPSEEIINSLEHYEYLGNDWIQKYNEAFLDFKMGL